MTEEEMRRHWKWMTAFMSFVILLAAFTAAWSQIVHLMPAHRGFVVEQVGMVEQQIRGLRFDILSDRRLNLRDQLRKLERMKKAAETDLENAAAPRERHLLNESLERLHNDAEELRLEYNRLQQTIDQLSRN